MSEPKGHRALKPAGYTVLSAFEVGASAILDYDFGVGDELEDGDALCLQALFTASPQNIVAFFHNLDPSTLTWAGIRNGTFVGQPFLVLARNNLGQPVEFPLPQMMSDTEAASWQHFSIVIASGDTSNLEVVSHIARSKPPEILADEFEDGAGGP